MNYFLPHSHIGHIVFKAKFKMKMRNCLNLILLGHKVVQLFQGCSLIYLISRGLIPTVIQIKPFQGFQETKYYMVVVC